MNLIECSFVTGARLNVLIVPNMHSVASLQVVSEIFTAVDNNACHKISLL
jgi:hypothetical protein